MDRMVEPEAYRSDAEANSRHQHFTAPPARVSGALCSDAGRASSWGESARERDGIIHCVFPHAVTRIEPRAHDPVPRMGRGLEKSSAARSTIRQERE